jgi:hypothetical protein
MCSVGEEVYGSFADDIDIDITVNLGHDDIKEAVRSIGALASLKRPVPLLQSKTSRHGKRPHHIAKRAGMAGYNFDDAVFLVGVPRAPRVAAADRRRAAVAPPRRQRAGPPAHRVPRRHGRVPHCHSRARRGGVRCRTRCCCRSS